MNAPGPSGPHTVDTTRPHPARIYNYFLGGRDWYEVDRQAALRAEQVYPGIGHAARRNRAFLHRVATFLAASGVRQFIDIGTGIPAPPNLHDIVWEIDPTAKFVYVDRDPTVLAFAAPFVKKSGGKAHFVNADAVQAELIMAEAERHLDLSKPVALTQVAIWHFIADGYRLPGSPDSTVYRPMDVMKRMLEPLASGSYLALSHVTTDLQPAQARALAQVYRDGGTPAQARSHAEILPFFQGLDLLAPGLVDVDQWHPELGDASDHSDPVPVYAGLARKP